MSSVPPLPLPEGVLARHVQVGNGPLAVLDAPAVGEHRGTVLLVPGYTGSKEDFFFVLAPLAQSGYRAVAVDQRGQYASPGPDDARAYTVDALGHDLLALAPHLGDGPVHLVGHSFGGLVTRAAVLADVTLFRSHVLMSSGPAALAGARADAMRLVRPVLVEGGLPAVWEATEAFAALAPGHVPRPADVTEFSRVRMVSGNAASLLAMGDGLLSEPDRTAELAGRGLPALVLHGETDDAWPPAVQAEMARRLEAQHVSVPGAAHSPAVEQPELTARALTQFFRSVG